MVFFIIVVCLILFVLLVFFRDKENYNYIQNPENPVVLVFATARDIEHNFSEKSMDLLLDTIDQRYMCIIVESNSSDNTLEMLKKWSDKDTQRRVVLTMGKLNQESRTERIGICRNKYLDYCEEKGLWNSAELVIVVDIDDIFRLEEDFKNQYETCFNSGIEWDAIGSNRNGRYYDIWALRSTILGIDYDCWKKVEEDTEGTKDSRIDKYVKNFQIKIPRWAPWIPCESAFGGLAIYKAKKVRYRRYDGNDVCEHVPFNMGLRMFINPALISGDDNVK